MPETGILSDCAGSASAMLKMGGSLSWDGGEKYFCVGVCTLNDVSLLKDLEKIKDVCGKTDM